MKVALRLFWTLMGRKLAADALHKAVTILEHQLLVVDEKASVGQSGIAEAIAQLAQESAKLSAVRARVSKLVSK